MVVTEVMVDTEVVVIAAVAMEEEVMEEVAMEEEVMVEVAMEEEATVVTEEEVMAEVAMEVEAKAEKMRAKVRSLTRLSALPWAAANGIVSCVCPMSVKMIVQVVAVVDTMMVDTIMAAAAAEEAVITPKEVKVVVVITPKEVKVVVVIFNGNILSCVSDTTTEYKEESIFVVLALIVLILMFMQKMVQELRDVVIVSWGKLYETKTFHLNQMENSFIKEVCWCLSYRGVSIL